MTFKVGENDDLKGGKLLICSEMGARLRGGVWAWLYFCACVCYCYYAVMFFFYRLCISEYETDLTI